MANTLTNLIPTILSAVDVVSRELTGFIPAVTLTPGAEKVAKDQTIRYPVAPAMTASAITPATTGPTPVDQTVSSDTMTITDVESVKWAYNGDEEVGLQDNLNPILQSQFAQAMRVLTNKIELALAALYLKTSGAYGAAATAPFASSLIDTAQILKVLKDRGAPTSDLQMVLGTTAGAALRTLSQLNKANEAADESLLRRGILLDVHGFAIRESGQVKAHTAGTGASATTDAAGYAIGATTITLASAGTGTILAGDIVSFAGDANKYTVVTGDGNVADGGTIVLAAPGLLVAMSAATKAITVTATHTANMAFSRSAIHLVTRTPLMPSGGDAADDVIDITDPVSGLVFQVAKYRQYRQTAYEVGIAWGVKGSKVEHIGRLIS